MHSTRTHTTFTLDVFFFFFLMSVYTLLPTVFFFYLQAQETGATVNAAVVSYLFLCNCLYVFLQDFFFLFVFIISAEKHVYVFSCVADPNDDHPTTAGTSPLNRYLFSLVFFFFHHRHNYKPIRAKNWIPLACKRPTFERGKSKIYELCKFVV